MVGVTCAINTGNEHQPPLPCVGIGAIHKQRIMSTSRRDAYLEPTSVVAVVIYSLLLAIGTSCARHGFPKMLHRATSHIFGSDGRPSATCVGR